MYFGFSLLWFKHICNTLQNPFKSQLCAFYRSFSYLCYHWMEEISFLSFVLIFSNNKSQTQKKLTAFPHLFLLSLSYSTQGVPRKKQLKLIPHTLNSYDVKFFGLVCS